MEILKTKNLRKRFGAFWALKDVSLGVEKGDLFGIIGGSAAGKSTLLRCLSSLEGDFLGEVFLYGKSVTGGKALRDMRQKVGMVFQHFHLLASRTVLENVLLPLEIQKKGSDGVLELLELVGLLGKKDCYVSTLSGGEKQRVSIARALIHNPDILFCDEPTSALDPKTKGEILTLLKELHQKLGLTIVLITHEMEVIRRLCNKVAVLDKGEVVEQGPVIGVFNTPQSEITRALLQNSAHAIDLSSLEMDGVFLRLHFKGASAKEPILSWMISTFQMEVSILSGWIDTVEGVCLGCLTIALKGDHLEEALAFLREKQVTYERITP